MIHEVIETSETAAIVMELVKGVTLRDAARKGASVDDVLRWGFQLANALTVAHGHGLIHGDIKPENVMVRDDGFLKLLDFGLALDAHPSETSGSQLGGTLRYLEPERRLGQPPTQAGDIFAFGVMLFELTTGRYPYESQTALSLLKGTTEEEAPHPAALRPDLPPALDRLITAMLARKAEERPSSREVADRLIAATQQAPRRPLAVPLALAACFALITLAGAAYWFRNSTGSGDFSRMSVRPLASQTGLENNPSISPDGLWVSCLYRAHSTDRPKLQVHSLQGGLPLEIETGGLIVQGPAAWSPDSLELAFEALVSPGVHAIYRVRRPGGVPVRLAECKSRINSPCEVDWSPDGARLAVSDVWKERSELYLIDIASGARRSLISPAKEHIAAAIFAGW
jgi:serine/threonine protein kinase